MISKIKYIFNKSEHFNISNNTAFKMNSDVKLKIKINLFINSEF